jgi:hypothetical protein
MNIPLDLSKSNIENELSIIISTINNNNQFLIQQIDDIYLGLLNSKVKISITEYFRWCKTAFQLFKSKNIPPQFVGGVSALRTIIDSLSDGDRRRVTKDVLQPHIPPLLSYIIITDTKDSPIFNCPISISSSNSSLIMKSSPSEISISILPNSCFDIFKSIFWTQSSIDIADADITSITYDAITILEGSLHPGQITVASSILAGIGI